MLKKVIHTMLLTALIGMNLFGVALPSVQAASLDPKGQACEAIGAASGASGDCTNPAGPDINDTLKLAINVFSLIVSVAAVVMIIIGGLKYILSNGDSGSINSAKNTILYAIIGLVVAALAQVAVRFVLVKV